MRVYFVILICLFCILKVTIYLQCCQWEIIGCEVWQPRPQKGIFVSFLVNCVSNVRSKIEKLVFSERRYFKNSTNCTRFWLFYFFLQSLHSRSRIIYGGCFKGPKIWIFARTTQEILSITGKHKISKYRLS